MIYQCSQFQASEGVVRGCGKLRLYHTLLLFTLRSPLDVNHKVLRVGMCKYLWFTCYALYASHMELRVCRKTR